VYHWDRAAGLSQANFRNIGLIISMSNFAGQEPLPCGKSQSMSNSGAFDMAGNVKEWVWNQEKERRYILGGAFNEPTYTFNDPEAQAPIERNPNFGFRLMQPTGRVPEAALAPINVVIRDFTNEKPVSDSVFELYKRMHAYDPS